MPSNPTTCDSSHHLIVSARGSGYPPGTCLRSLPAGNLHLNLYIPSQFPKCLTLWQFGSSPPKSFVMCASGLAAILQVLPGHKPYYALRGCIRMPLPHLHQMVSSVHFSVSVCVSLDLTLPAHVLCFCLPCVTFVCQFVWIIGLCSDISSA